VSVTIRPLSTQSEFRALVELEQRVWPGVPPMREDVLLMATRNEGLVLGAFDSATDGGEKMVGLLFGYLGRAADGRYRHWSHMVGIAPAYRDRQVGFRLKLAQREHVLGQGLDLIAWSYDPLLSRNAYLNIHKLGAVCRTYVRDFYGEMPDGLNAGLPSDRFEVEWYIASRHVIERLNGLSEAPSLGNLVAGGARLMSVQPQMGSGSPPLPNDFWAADDLCVPIPQDFHGLKRQDIALARGWRDCTRELFEVAFERGHCVVDVVREATASYYRLRRGWQPD
jgi:predicted GNAT superfamily acetyltransferase